MLDALYAEVRACVVDLADAGFQPDADALDRCLYGSTSGEILADLGANLKSIGRNAPGPSGDLRRRLVALLGRVDAVLKQVGRL